MAKFLLEKKYFPSTEEQKTLQQFNALIKKMTSIEASARPCLEQVQKEVVELLPRKAIAYIPT